MQVEKMRHQCLALRSFRPARVGQNGSDFSVRKTRLAKHHGGVKLVGVYFALGIDQHVAHHAQAFHIRVQRTQAVGQLFRQHGDHAARKIHAGGAVVGVDVNGTAVFYIVAHIGNRDQQTPAFATAYFCRFAINRIVKVARVLAVNGHKCNVCQINAAFFI